VRALLWLEREAHWKLLDHGDNSCEFIFPDGVKFVFFGEHRNRSVPTARVVCESVRLARVNGRQEYLQVVYFYGLAAAEDAFSFTFPANCVWVAGEVEL